jgi:hypothetical protein
MDSMPAFKATVRHGRIVLDEPTTLPEGAEVRLVAAIAAAEQELDDGQAVPPDALWARLRAIP